MNEAQAEYMLNMLDRLLAVLVEVRDEITQLKLLQQEKA